MSFDSIPCQFFRSLLLNDLSHSTHSIYWHHEKWMFSFCALSGPMFLNSWYSQQACVARHPSCSVAITLLPFRVILYVPEFVGGLLEATSTHVLPLPSLSFWIHLVYRFLMHLVHTLRDSFRIGSTHCLFIIIKRRWIHFK